MKTIHAIGAMLAIGSLAMGGAPGVGMDFGSPMEGRERRRKDPSRPEDAERLAKAEARRERRQTRNLRHAVR